MMENKKTLSKPGQTVFLLVGADRPPYFSRPARGLLGALCKVILSCLRSMNWTKFIIKKESLYKEKDKLKDNSGIDWTSFLPAASVSLALLTTPLQSETLALPHYPLSCPLSPVLLIPLFYIPHFQLIIFLH